MQNDLIVGRKSIMSMLKITNWASVVKLIKRSGCPVGKLEGRWVARHSVLLEWIDAGTGAVGSRSVLIRSTLSKVEHLPSDPHQGMRGRKMPLFLEKYSQGKSIRSVCREIGIGLQTYYNWRKNYERFDTACKDVEKVSDAPQSCMAEVGGSFE